MAKELDKSTIITGNAITSGQISQSIDALTGIEAYNLTISGSLNINDAPVTNLTASGNISSSGTIIGSNLSGTNTGDQDLQPYVLSTNTASFAITSSNVLFSNITASGNISASGGYVLAQYFAMNFPNTGTTAIQMSVPNRIDISPNNSTAIRLTSSSVSLNKDTSVNGDITSVTNITASGNISSSGNIIGLSGSFSEISGNSPLSINGSINVNGTIASGLITSGSRTRKIRTVTLTATGTNSLNAAQTVQPDDDIILVVGNTTSTIGGSDFTFNCTDLFYAQASEVGRIVTIANVNSAVGSDLILGAPDPGDDPYTANGASTSARFDTVCNSIGDEVNIVVIGSKTVAIYGSGI